MQEMQVICGEVISSVRSAEIAENIGLLFPLFPVIASCLIERLSLPTVFVLTICFIPTGIKHTFDLLLNEV